MISIAALNKKLKSRPVSLTMDERGLTTVEYIIILVLIAVGGIGLWTSFGGSVNAKIKDSTAAIGSLEQPTK